MKKLFLLFTFFVICQNALSQPFTKGRVVDMVIHKVELGETVVMICKKYLVNPKTIYSANKFIIDGVNEGMVLQIPVPRKEGQEYATMQYAQPVIDDEVIPDAIIAAINPVVIKDNSIAANDDKDEPEVVKDEPVAVKDEPIVVKDEPEVVKDEPVAVKDEPIVVKDEPEVVKDEPVAVKDEPVAIIETKTIVIEEPNKTIAAVEPEKDPVFETKRLTISKIERDVETQYTIQSKETLFEISKRYEVTMEEIMERNADVLKNGLVVGQVITIPANKKIIGWDDSKTSTTENGVAQNNTNNNATKVETKIKTIEKATSEIKTESGFTSHKVAVGETLYSLSKKYFTTVEIILENNESVRKKGLGIGTKIKIPLSKTGKAAETGAVAALDKKIEEFVAPVRELDSNDTLHKVVAGETLNSLSKKYNASVYDIRSNNQNIMSKGLQVGQTIRIPKPKTAPITKDDIAAKIDQIATTEARTNEDKNKKEEEEVFIVGDIITTVQANETIEEIAKKYDVTPDEIIKNNANLIKDRKVKPGQVIKVPANKGAVEFSPETFD